MKHVILLFSLVFITSVQAQNLKIFQGDYEINGSAQLSQAALGGEFSLGTFIQDYLQVGGDAAFFDSDFYTRYSIGAYVSLLFDTGTYWLPYVGSGLKLAALEPVFLEKETGIELEIFGGVKYFLADNVSLNTEIRLGVSSADTYLENDEYANTDYRVNIGLSYYW